MTAGTTFLSRRATRRSRGSSRGREQSRSRRIGRVERNVFPGRREPARSDHRLDPRAGRQRRATVPRRSSSAARPGAPTSARSRRRSRRARAVADRRAQAPLPVGRRDPRGPRARGRGRGLRARRRGARSRSSPRPTSFGGSLDDLERPARAAGLPILRKDFIVDPYQVAEAAGGRRRRDPADRRRARARRARSAARARRASSAWPRWSRSTTRASSSIALDAGAADHRHQQPRPDHAPGRHRHARSRSRRRSRTAGRSSPSRASRSRAQLDELGATPASTRCWWGRR